MSDLEKLPESLRKHHQCKEASCAVSGFECIAKLHGFIAPNAFPLQSDPANQKKGFGDTSFLKSLGLDTSELYLSPAEATDLIESETEEGRFPLAVQMIGRNAFGNYDAHTYICAMYNGRLLLIDPAFPKIQAAGKAEITQEFESKIKLFPARQTIHVLKYTKKQ